MDMEQHPTAAHAASEFTDADDQMGDINAGIWKWCLVGAVLLAAVCSLIVAGWPL